MSTTTRKKPRQAAVGCEPLLSIDDISRHLGISRRLLDRMRSAGQFPKPDLHAGTLPRWTAATFNAWVEKGGR